MAKRKRRVRDWLIWVAIVLGMIVSLALIFNEQIKLFMVGQMSDNAVRSAQTVDAAEMQKNRKAPATFDFAKTEALDLSTVTKAALARNLKPIGLMSVPSVGIYLPILNGVSSQNLAVGASTMKANQVLGAGNYALAGHHIHKTANLFSPLENVKNGAMIYLTDKSKVYAYKIYFQKVVDKSQVQYIDDVPGKKIVTLVTCASNQILQPERQIVRGELVSVKKADDTTLKVFAK